MKKVLIFRENLLPFSETFVYTQAFHFKTYTPYFTGIHYTPNPILKNLNHFILNDNSPVGFIRECIYKTSGYSNKLIKIIQQINPDIIHIHFGTDATRLLTILIKLSIPFVVTFHGYDANSTDEWKIQQNKFIYKKYLAKRSLLDIKASRFIAVSNYVKNCLILQGYNPNKIEVCPIGIDLEFFKPPTKISRNKTILFVGRIVRLKGLNYLLYAMHRVQQYHPDIELLIIGDGPQRKKMDLLAQKLSVTCRFLGILPHNSVRDMMQSVMAVCIPSISTEEGSETFGLALAEAQASGTPTISFDIGGISEVIINGETGFLCQEGNIEQLAEKIILLFTDHNIWKKISSAAVLRTRQYYDIKNTTGKLEMLYNKMV